MKAVVTVLGKDRTGIIAEVSHLLYLKGVNILDISQTILSGMFTMIMLVELGQDSQYDQVRNDLLALAEDDCVWSIYNYHAEIRLWNDD